MKRNRVVYVIVAIIIIAGVINTYLNKFAFSLAYDSSERMDVYIGKDYDTNEIKGLVQEVLGTDEILVQEVETFNDMAAITARTISDEQKQSIVDKLNEKYETEIKLEEVAVTKIPHYDGTDLLNRYVVPMAISAVIITVYVAIRYKKLGMLKISTRTILWSIIIELLYVSIISLARIPVSFYTIPLGIVIEIITLISLMNTFEKELESKKIEERKTSKKTKTEVDE